MRIDYALIRQIMLSIESENFREKYDKPDIFTFQDSWYYSEDQSFNSKNKIDYHLNYLEQSCLLSGVSVRAVSSSGRFVVNMSARPDLTPSGHEFLNAVRSERVFKTVLKKISDLGGSVAIGIVQKIAESVLLKMLDL